MSRADASEEARVVAGSAGHGHAQDLSLPGAVAGEQQQPPPPGRQASALMGLQNQGATCYMNSLIQACFMLPEFRHGLYSIDPDALGIRLLEGPDGGISPGHRPRKIPLELQRLFAELQLLDQDAVPTRRLTENGFGWGRADAAVQHDVQELNRLLFDAIEQSLRGKPGGTLINDVYAGVLAGRVQCRHCGAASEQEEPFTDLSVPVQGHSTLGEGMAALVGSEVLSGDNQYHCSACDRRCDADKSSRLERLPHVLIASLNRFVFDLATCERAKVSDRCAFPLILDMRPFTQGAASSAAVPAAALAGDSVWAEDLRTGPGRQRAARVAAATAGHPHVYDLVAVVVHRGNAGRGHYHAYIRDMLGEGRWTPPPLAREEARRLRETAVAPAALDAARDTADEVLVDLVVGHPQAPECTLLAGLAEEAAAPPRRGRIAVADIDHRVREITGRSWTQQYRRTHGMLSTVAARSFPHLVWRSYSGAYLELRRGVEPCFEELSVLCQRAKARLVDPIVREAAERALGSVAEEEVEGVHGQEPPPVDVDADEEFARQLQAEEEAKRGRWNSLLGRYTGGSGSAGADSGDGGWHTVSRNKKRRASGSAAAASPPAGTSQRAKAEQVVEDVAAEAVRAALKAWTPPVDNEADELREAGWGSWFDFDDASVRPASVMQLPALYGASGQSAAADCAYMLFYRSRAAEGGSGLLGLPQRQSRTAIPEPPSVWRDVVQRCNEELQQARAGWHRAERELRLHVVPASSLRAVDAALTAPSLGAGAPLSDIEGAREVVVPRGTTQNGLVQAVADAFEGSGDGVPSPPHRIRLHRLQRCLSGLHMYEPLPPWGGDVREVASGSVVVAWDGEHVGAGDHAQAGSHCEPLTVQVTSLEEEVGPEGGRHSVPLTIARNTSMSDLRARVAAAARLTLHHRMSIHLVRETPGDAGRTGKAKCEAVRLPAKLGWGEQLGDFGVGHGSELLVEMDSMVRCSKARRELSRRESLLDVMVLVAPEADASEGQRGASAAEEWPSIALSLSPRSLVCDLTRDACELLGLDPPASYRLRRFGAAGGRGALLCSGASDTLRSQGVVDGTELILERGRALASGEVEVWYRVRSRSGEGHGTRGGEAAAVVVHRRDAVRELKKAFCIAEGLAQPEEPRADLDARCHLRRTDANGEGTTLVRGEGRQLDEEAIANGDLLLLEPGPLPERTTTVHLYLWQPDRARTRVVPRALCEQWHEAAARHRLPVEPLQEWLSQEDTGDDGECGETCWERELARRVQCLLPLGEVEVRPTDSDHTLRQHVLDLHTLKEEVGGALAAMEDHQLCLRELTDEWTPGRVLHVVGKSVKALGLHDGGHVVLQFLEWPEPLKPYDAVFWVLRRYVADGVAGVAWSVPLEWPPSELVVRGQTHLGEPSFDDLRNAVANWLRTNPASVVMARLDPQKATWATLRAGKGRQRDASIRGAPHRLEDGTVLAVSTASGDRSGQDTWDRQQEVGKRESMAAQPQARDEGAGAREGGAARNGCAEAGLSLGDLDFRDSEGEDEANGSRG